MNPHQLFRIILRPEAEAEVRGAALWYQKQERGLGQAFLRAFRASTSGLRRNPRLYPRVADEARRVLLRRFPYAVIYEIHGSEVVVLACMHCARNPEVWRRRLPRPDEP